MPDTPAAPLPDGLITTTRKEFHAALLSGILTLSDVGVPSNADKNSKPSREVAKGIVDRLGPALTATKLAGQTAGSDFEEICRSFVDQSIHLLTHFRPGTFVVTKGGDISQFDQYAHLDDLELIAKSNREIATALGSDYLIKPDITVARQPLSDLDLNAHAHLVDDTSARLSALRRAYQPLPVLHASVSCKWTLRSDRAQNARSEGLNLVRNRKGRLPHVTVITGEPLPSRIASLALGTGDIDCVYHFALYELRDTLVAQDREGYLDILDTMIDGKRLKDISDLPLDLVT